MHLRLIGLVISDFHLFVKIVDIIKVAFTGIYRILVKLALKVRAIKILIVSTFFNYSPLSTIEND